MGCHCESAPRPWQSVSLAPRFLCLRRLPFFLRQKKGRKERRQNQGFGILYAAGVSSTSVSSYLADRDVQNLHLAFVWSLRRHPLAAHAGPRCPDAAGIHSTSTVLCATFLAIVRRGRCPHRPALLYFLSPVGRGDHTSPPGIAPQLMKKPCHCEGAPRPRRSVSPAPQKEVALRPPLNFCLHWRSLLLLQLAHQSNMQFVQLLLHSPQNGGAFCGVPSQDFNPRRK